MKYAIAFAMLAGCGAAGTTYEPTVEATQDAAPDARQGSTSPAAPDGATGTPDAGTGTLAPDSGFSVGGYTGTRVNGGCAKFQGNWCWQYAGAVQHGTGASPWDWVYMCPAGEDFAAYTQQQFRITCLTAAPVAPDVPQPWCCDEIVPTG